MEEDRAAYQRSTFSLSFTLTLYISNGFELRDVLKKPEKFFHTLPIVWSTRRPGIERFKIQEQIQNQIQEHILTLLPVYLC